TTVSSYPTIPGKIGSPVLSFAIRLSRSSSLTRRVRSRCSLNSLFRSSPRGVGRFITDEITSRKLYAGVLGAPVQLAIGDKLSARPPRIRLPIPYAYHLLPALHYMPVRSAFFLCVNDS